MQRRALIGAAIVAAVCGLQAADRPEITFTDGRIFPESLTSTKNGTLYFGSLGQDSVYRATGKEEKASVWIQPKSNGLQTVLGVFADEPAGTLWVCASAGGGRGGTPVVGETAMKAFSLKDASFKASYAVPRQRRLQRHGRRERRHGLRHRHDGRARAAAQEGRDGARRVGGRPDAARHGRRRGAPRRRQRLRQLGRTGHAAPHPGQGRRLGGRRSPSSRPPAR